MKFFASQNNGVVAVIGEAHASLYATVKKSGGDPIAAGCRVFTFCPRERLERDLSERMVFTGSYEDLDHLLKAGGHEIGQGCGGWDGHVPFSNGIQYGYTIGGLAMGAPEGYQSRHNAAERELRFVTSLADIIAAFGVIAPQNTK